MTTVLLNQRRQRNWRLPQFAFVFAFSIVGLFVSLALAVATWPDGPTLAP
jgi:hypothetical protein